MNNDETELYFELPAAAKERMRASLLAGLLPKDILVSTPSAKDDDAELLRIIKTRLYGEEPPLTTTRRSSGFSIEEDEAYRIAVWHYDYQGSRGDFWLNEDTATKRLRNKVLGIVTPTAAQTMSNIGLLEVGGPSPLYRSHRQDNTRQNQKKRNKRRKQVLKKHRH